jgi:hypothetical protein
MHRSNDSPARMEERRPLRRQPNDLQLRRAADARCDRRRVSAGNLDRHQGTFLFPPRVSDPLKATSSDCLSTSSQHAEPAAVAR